MTVALSSMRDDHVLTFRSIESEIVAFDPVIDCVDVILQSNVILRTVNFPIELLTYRRHKVYQLGTIRERNSCHVINIYEK